MAGGSREPGRTVTSKVLAILEAFENSRGALSLTDIAEKSGLPLSAAHRLVNELTDWGVLSREPNGRYQLGIRLWELAQNTGRQLRDAARPYVQDLFSLTGETAHLAVRAGHEVLYIDRVYGSRRVPRASRVGGRLPMRATAVGKVILAFEEDWVRDAYLNRQLEAVALANNTEFGLGGLVFGKDPEAALAVADRMDTGSVGLNFFASNHAAPFGGGRHNFGLGTEYGIAGLNAYLSYKSIHRKG